MIDEAITEIEPMIGTLPACRALGASRAGVYRRRRPPRVREHHPRPAPARALSEAERARVLEQLHSARFVDSSPAEVWATLLDEGTYLASERTMYRLLAADGEVRDRRDQLTHPPYARPELLAERPNEVWSWDITKLLGPAKWTYYYLYAILDFSRYVIGWTVQLRETGPIAEQLITQTLAQQQINRGQLTIHADRGSSMTSKPVAFLLSDLWMPDERCRILRRRLNRREQLVHARSRAKNEISAVLARRLIERPPFADLFGVTGRRWLAEVGLPVEERESVDAGLRQIAFLDSEIKAVEKLVAQQALSWPEIRRLMTVPGVNLICAATFIAAIGGAERFLTSRKLVAYLGLDPKVRQSGEAPARSGRISKRGSASARWALVEAACSVVKQPGPLRAFYERVRARRGHGKAIVATARKLAILFWCMLTRRQDYAHQRPALTKKKLRELELTAGAKPRTKAAAGVWSTNRAIRDAERALTEQAEISYQRMITDQQAGRPSRKVGASATPERA